MQSLAEVTGRMKPLVQHCAWRPKYRAKDRGQTSIIQQERSQSCNSSHRQQAAQRHSSPFLGRLKCLKFGAKLQPALSSPTLLMLENRPCLGDQLGPEAVIELRKTEQQRWQEIVRLQLLKESQRSCLLGPNMWLMKRTMSKLGFLSLPLKDVWWERVSLARDTHGFRRYSHPCDPQSTIFTYVNVTIGGVSQLLSYCFEEIP